MLILDGVDQYAMRKKYDRVEGHETCCQNVHITANNETKSLNVFKFTGTIQIKEQFAEITEVTALTNMTDVYADIWDGTNSINLTKSPGADFSGLCVGSFFTKDLDATNTYTVLDANQVRFNEAITKDVGKPFLITAKTGVDNYIRFNFTTNTVLNYKMSVYFWYRLIDGGTLELA